LLHISARNATRLRRRTGLSGGGRLAWLRSWGTNVRTHSFRHSELKRQLARGKLSRDPLDALLDAFVHALLDHL
jgi:hypothetical protein